MNVSGLNASYRQISGKFIEIHSRVEGEVLKTLLGSTTVARIHPKFHLLKNTISGFPCCMRFRDIENFLPVTHAFL